MILQGIYVKCSLNFYVQFIWVKEEIFFSIQFDGEKCVGRGSVWFVFVYVGTVLFLSVSLKGENRVGFFV